MQRHPPAARAGQEMLDMILAASQFCEQFSVLFCEAGVLQLAKKQDLAIDGWKNYTKAYAAFPLYDIHACYVDQAALTTHHLTVEDLVLPVKMLNPNQLEQLIESHDAVIRG